jgi:vinculin
MEYYFHRYILSGGHTIVESIENRDYVVNKMSDELGEIIRILQLITIDDVLLNEFDEDEQHNLKKLLVKNFQFQLNQFFIFC